ncbi:prolyl oligopeptidase family serine peptidase [Nitriliruptor alkaliphilus]|uniref:prolyl oligopeptidase family serine peptidase n=1 Tax=Nitriliruptor alkaliphilus TaxID=427918 RepID=UPI000698E50B|nr:prolyl oligopeptidase family serine peptidase [Nitriliruptor alkaliphilus]
MSAPATTPDPAPVPVPETRRDDLVEVLHGVGVADPYRWLEDAAAPAVRAWVDAQRAATDPVLDALPARTAFRARLDRLWSVPRRGVPWRKGDTWFQVRSDGQQDQDVLWTARADDAERRVLPGDGAWQVLLDPNAWTTDGTASLSGLAITDDGAQVAYGRSDAGSDWVTWHVVDLDRAGPDGPLVQDDVVPWSKFTGAVWLPGGRSFLYGAYDQPPPGEEVTATTQGQRLQQHVVGTVATEDIVVHERPDQPEWGFQPHVAHGDRWLVLTVWRGTDPTNRIHLAPLTAAGEEADTGGVGEVVPLLDDGDARYDVVGVLTGTDGRDELIVVTDLEAPMGRVLAIDLTDATRRRELVAASDERMESARLVGGDTPDDPAWLVCTSLRHATSRLAVHDPLTGTWSHDVELPSLGTVIAVTGGRTDAGVHIGVSSFAASDEIWYHDLVGRRTTRVTSSAVPAPDAAVVTEQVLVHHQAHLDDGRGATDVAVPVFLIHRADVRPTGEVPTILWGYGGFDIPVTPAFRPAWRAWVDAGGLLAVACLRGGGEYGRAWHDAGRGTNRPAVQADALAVAAWLTGDDRDGQVHATAGLAPRVDDPLGEVTAPTPAAGPTVGGPDATWTAAAHLGVEGRSNGGLLVGTCITAEPGRFASAVPEVGVLDLLRFHRFTIGWAWTSDYGSPDDPDAFPTLHALSPYHRLLRSDGARFPATLVTTGDTDDRVVPAHSYKFAAALQAAQAGAAPVLLRVDVSAGHGAGKPVAKLLDERADVLAWHAHHLGLGASALDPTAR